MTDLDVPLNLEALRVQEPNNEVLRDLFVELEFRRLADQFALRGTEWRVGVLHGAGFVDASAKAVDYQTIDEAVRSSGVGCGNS